MPLEACPGCGEAGPLVLDMSDTAPWDMWSEHVEACIIGHQKPGK